MKKILSFVMALSAALLVAGCAKPYDDTDLRKEMDKLSQQVKAYAEQVASYQSQVNALKTVVEAVQAGDYVTKVETIEGGVTITFAKKGVVTILNGAKGDPGEPGEPGTPGTPGEPGTPGTPGETPVIAVQEIDGVMYWTVNGEKTVPVYQATPQFRVLEGKWQYSIDEGQTWIDCGPAAGGDSIFSKVEDLEDAVVFTLANGSTISIPKEQAFELVIAKGAVVEAGETVEIPYTVKNATQNTVVDAFAGGAYKVVVEEAQDKASGTVKVTVPAVAEDGQVLVWADNGAGKASIKKLSFEGATFTVTAVDEVDAEGATVEVKVVSNLEYTVEPQVDWITFVETKAAKESTIVLTVAANTGEIRSGDVKIKRADNGNLIQTISIAQKAGVPEKVVKLEKVFGLYGQAGVAGWPGLISGIEDLDGNIRNACFDDNFIYIPKTKGVDVDEDGSFDEVKVFKFNISDGSYAGLVQRTTDPDYMAGTWASTFPVSCVRIMKNDDATVNGGKDILVASNLCDGQNVRVYAWVDGVDNQPKLLTNFSSSRRFGDKFSVEGTYQDGRLWFRSMDADGMVCYVNLVPGYTSGFNGCHAWNWVEPLGKIPADDATNISEFYSFGKGAYGLIATNSSVGTHLVKGTAEQKVYPDLKRCFGWNAFTFKDKDYLAFLYMGNGTDKPVVRILEGASNTVDALQATLDANVIAFEAAFATADVADMTTGTAYATNNVGDCQVRVIDGVPYILGCTRGSIAMFRLIEE